jgi:ABC-type branched-subunit amino acid transport system substrate-binding protein
VQPDALFIPAPASQLELIAPQLASTGVTRMPGIKQVKAARLYATAEGLNARLLLSTGKYLEGAVLAPVFYADAGAGMVGDFVERYRAAYPGGGNDPTSLDALAYEAVRAVRVALHRAGGSGLPTRAALGAAIAQVDEAGLTGPLKFGAAGERTGGPALYQVENGALRPVQ